MKPRVLCFALVLVLAVCGLAIGQQQTGTLNGTVKDQQGGVLPGATVTIISPALLGGPRTVVTGEAGAYRFAQLPPGTYTVTFEMASFAPLTREGIVINVARTTTLNVELGVGGIDESVTVTGESPVVDVKSTITQTNIEEELYEAVPTGRNPWTMAALVPGVIAGRLDVGGTEGMQQYNLEVFGSEDNQKSFSIDGLKTNWTGGGGGATMQYYDFAMYDEYNFQTASGTAESDVGGVYMNMVTRSGGNNVESSHVMYFMNDSTQGDNIDDELRQKMGLKPGQKTGAAGNPIDISYDWNSNIGGPIVKDKLWFFGSVRWWRMDMFQIGALNPDGSQAIDDNRIINGMGKVSYQTDPETKMSFFFNRNQKTRFHRRNAPYLFVEDKASSIQDQPAQNFIYEVSRVFGTAGLLHARVGRMWGTYPEVYQKEVKPTDITVQDVSTFQRWNAAPYSFEDPNSRLQLNATYSHFLEHTTGTHDLKTGIQVSREMTEYTYVRNGDVVLQLKDGVPFTVELSNTPVDSIVYVNTWGAFVQDSWAIKNRLTLNLGVRFDGIQGYSPEQSSPAGTFVGERRFPKITGTPDWPLNIAPRLGFSYDLLGDGKTALKGYYGRFYNQIGADIPNNVNPNDYSTATVVWNDLDGDRVLATGPSGTFRDSRELGPFTGFVGGVTTLMDPDAERPYSEEMNFGISHTLATNLSIDVSYHRRHHRDLLGIVDLARPPSAYTPVTRDYVDPVDGPRTITIYNLDPALRAVRDRRITNVPELKSNYNGFHIQMNKRMSNNWQLLAGLTLQKHEGFFHSGTFSTEDFNNPNVRLNRENARIFVDLPWVLTMSGSYRLPYDIILAGKYTGRAGDPLRRQATFGGLTQASETVDVVPRGTDRPEAVTQFVDLRVSKEFRVAEGSRFELGVDMFNILNANHVLLQNEVIGTAWARPTRILAPRIFRFMARYNF